MRPCIWEGSLEPSSLPGRFPASNTVRAGPGDLVTLVGSREASLGLENTFVPVDSCIVGIVDQVDA